MRRDRDEGEPLSPGCARMHAAGLAVRGEPSGRVLAGDAAQHAAVDDDDKRHMSWWSQRGAEADAGRVLAGRPGLEDARRLVKVAPGQSKKANTDDHKSDSGEDA